jgi:hypothetical protein
MQRISPLFAAGALAVGQLLADGAVAANLFVVHGINGEDLGESRAFPVDILIDLPPTGRGREDLCGGGVEFTDRLGPGVLEAGLYGIEIHEAVLIENGPLGCDGELLVADVLSISEIETAIVLLHLDAQGAPVVGKYTVNAFELAGGEVRISAIHAAVSGAADIEVLERNTGDEAAFPSVLNGQQTFPLEGQEGRYQIQFLDATTGDRLARRTVTLDEDEVGVGILVGSTADDTLEILRLLIDTTAPPPPMAAAAGAG